MMNNETLLTILGPTASGKTALAALMAYRLGGEIISADSRQVYRGMDIGTGKDLADYTVCGTQIPYHLIDIANPGDKYNVYEFQRDCLQAYESIRTRGHQPIMCGGSGLYLESVIRGYRMSTVPQNPELRASLVGKTLDELTTILSGYTLLHNTTDVDTAQRAIRAIEIQDYYRSNPLPERELPAVPSVNIGVSIDRELRRERITARLRARLDEGMVDEIRGILDSGVSAEDLIYYGLEYKFVTLYVIGQLTFDEMVPQLEIAIHQFAKRQMTWFRGMERRGVMIHWIDGSLPLEQRADQIENILTSL